MGKDSRPGEWTALIAAKIVCCGILLLFLTGVVTLSGVGSWIRDGNPAWLAMAGAGAIAAIGLWFRQRWRGDATAAERPRSLETKGTS